MSMYPYSYAPVPRPPAAPYDGRSVAALVLLGTVIAAPVSIVLGVLGIRATAGGRRRGRWCAVLAIVGSILVMLVLPLGAVLLRTPAPEVHDPFARLDVGDCVDLQVGDDEPYATRLGRRSCTTSHDGEVVFRGRLDVFQAAELFDKSAAQLCKSVMTDWYRTEMATGRYSMRVISVGVPWEPEDGDPFLCVAGGADGEPLNAAIGRSA